MKKFLFLAFRDGNAISVLRVTQCSTPSCCQL